MTRDEAVKGLERVLSGLGGVFHGPDCAAVRAAIALLTPPSDALVNAAKAFVGLTVDVVEMREILLRALDALAREPGLETDLERARANALVLASQSVALEAKLARVRELIDHPRLGGVRDEHTVTVGQVRAALAADAAPVDLREQVAMAALDRAEARRFPGGVPEIGAPLAADAVPGATSTEETKPGREP